MRILVTGKNGQLARSFEDIGEEDVEIVTLGRPDLDIIDQASVEHALDRYSPDIVVNAAAYTAVDKAEEDPLAAFKVNRDGTRNVAQATAARQIPIIHISTDYVFNGEKKEPYTEEDAVGPINVYGLSKLQGEWAVQDYNPDHVILRAAWVYSPYGHNFVKTMLKLAETHDEIRVVCDQWGAPTSAAFLVTNIVHIARRVLGKHPPQDWRGIFNIAPDGKTNWADFAVEVLKNYMCLDCKENKIIPILAKDYRVAAKRPENSLLSSMKLQSVYGLQASTWHDLLMNMTIDVK